MAKDLDHLDPFGPDAPDKKEAPGIGHNRPPTSEEEAAKAAASDFEPMRGRIADLIKTANRWCTEVGEIANTEQAGRANAFLEQIASAWKAADDARMARRRPLQAAMDMIQAMYTRPMAELDAAKDLVKAKLRPWLKAEEDRKAAEVAAAREAERKAQAEADEARRRAEAAAAGQGELNVQAQVEAAEKAKAAEAAAAKTSRTERRSTGSRGAGSRARTIRRTQVPVIVDIEKAAAHYRERAKVRDAILACAREDLKNKLSIESLPGIGLETKETL